MILSPIFYIEITLGRDLFAASMNRKNDYSDQSAIDMLSFILELIEKKFNLPF